MLLELGHLVKFVQAEVNVSIAIVTGEFGQTSAVVSHEVLNKADESSSLSHTSWKLTERAVAQKSARK
jgi:hypothetical protein